MADIYRNLNGEKQMQIGNSWYAVTDFSNLPEVHEKQNGALPVPVPMGTTQIGLSDRTNQTEMLKSYHTWVHRAARIIAENVAKQKLFLFIERNNEKQKVNAHPLIDLFKKVNPVQTKYDLWELTMIFLELTGNSYWFKAKDRLGVTRELWPIRPDLMKPVPDPVEVVRGYIYEFQGKKIPFGRDEIIHLMYPNPLNMWLGMGTLQAAAYIFDADLFQRKFQINTFKNQARPDAVLETDQWGLDADTLNRNREEWYKLYGGVENAKKVAILQGGVKYKQISLSPQELEFLESTKATRNDILGIFGVPRSKAGIVEDVNRANAEAENFVFASDVILPKLCKIQEKLNQDLVAEFDERLFIEFENPVPEDKDFKIKDRESNLKNFVTSINEERQSQGLVPVDWGERPWGGFNLVPLGESGGAAGELAAEGVQARRRPFLKRSSSKRSSKRSSDILFNEGFRLAQWKRFEEISRPQEKAFTSRVKGLFRDQKRLVLSNLAKVRNLGKDVKQTEIDFILFDKDAWIKEFQEKLDPVFRQALLAGADKAIEDIAAGTGFDINSPVVNAFLDEKKFKFAEKVNETTTTKLRETLLDGLAEDETIEQLSKRVQGVFNFAEKVRAPRIARTEVNTSTNFGIHDAYRQSRIVEQKNWLSQRDGDVRDSHQIDSEVIGLSERFSNGLLYPGDPDGDGADIIHCRCTTLPVVNEN